MLSPVPFWSKIPFLRLLIPLMAGIIVQWYAPLSLLTILIIGAISIGSFIITQFFTLRIVFQYGWISGVIINALLFTIGAFLLYNKNIHNNTKWFGRFYKDHSTIQATILEPPVEKENSFKALAEIDLVVADQKIYQTKGRIILYFKKDSSVQRLQYGKQIIFNNNLQLIKNSGNPGAFDYNRYCLFNGITHQVYLIDKDYVLSDTENKEWLDLFLFNAKQTTVNLLRKYITSRKELGLAEALLIGYKDDLDKGLVQSYTNTGVVHIIAISGQHLALIYWLLLQILAPLKRTRGLKWLNTIIIISVLWLFSLMTGAQPSIIRAALMCTIILLAESLSRRSNTLNSLACSAFVLLWFNPFNLWDVGFQLSFAGLLSLVIFTRPIYNLVYVDNGMLRYVWQLISATIAAQILTTPISIYHFHQFPFSFLLTNLLAVPLSGLVLISELLMFALSLLPPLAIVFGKLLTVMIWLMNTWVERIEGLPAMLWDGLQISFAQVVFLYVAIIGFTIWMIDEVKRFVWIGASAIILFFIVRGVAFHQAREQKQLLVYNVSKHSGVDIIDGRKFYFIGDDELMEDGFLKNFNIKPSRVLHRMQSVQKVNKEGENICIKWFDKTIMITNNSQDILANDSVDLLIVSSGFEIRNDLILRVKQIVIDGSFASWKVRQLEEHCKALKIPCYNVATNGAFILNLKQKAVGHKEH